MPSTRETPQGRGTKSLKGGGGDSHMKRLRMLIGNFCFDPQEVLKRVWFKLFFQPLKGTKTGIIQNQKRAFRDKGFILSRKFTSLAPEPLSGTVSTPKCYSLMFGSLSGTRTRDFDLDARSSRTSIPDLCTWEYPPSGTKSRLPDSAVRRGMD